MRWEIFFVKREALTESNYWASLQPSDLSCTGPVSWDLPMRAKPAPNGPLHADNIQCTRLATSLGIRKVK